MVWQQFFHVWRDFKTLKEISCTLCFIKQREETIFATEFE